MPVNWGGLTNVVRKEKNRNSENENRKDYLKINSCQLVPKLIWQFVLRRSMSRVIQYVRAG